MSDTLRDQIAQIVSVRLDDPYEYADRILAIPRLQEALRFVEGSPGFEPLPDGGMLGTGLDDMEPSVAKNIRRGLPTKP